MFPVCGIQMKINKLACLKKIKRDIIFVNSVFKEIFIPWDEINVFPRGHCAGKSIVCVCPRGAESKVEGFQQAYENRHVSETSCA